MNPTFKMGFGTIIGSGEQYLPWIHIEDLSQIYLKAITDSEMSGPYNAAVTDNTTNKSLSKTLAQLYGYKIWLPKIPPFILKIAMGEMSLAILEGRRVSSEKIRKTGFKFEYTDLKTALSNCLS
jgi:NAD dependent epimerase/dehydratase family enzyme